MSGSDIAFQKTEAKSMDKRLLVVEDAIQLRGRGRGRGRGQARRGGRERDERGQPLLYFAA
jgi:hypothetical protein